MTKPFIQANTVVFETATGELLVGDLINEPARYTIPLRGICHLPANALVAAKADEPGAFNVDNAQIFFVDAQCYEGVATDIVDRGNIEPNYALYEVLREKHSTAFGYVVSSDLYDTPFDGDGTYRIIVEDIRPGLPDMSAVSPDDAQELLRKIISRMNTLVCAKCFTAELNSHPSEGPSPRGKNQKKKWCIAMAEYALSQGWTAIPEAASFGDITPLCPECAK